MMTEAMKTAKQIQIEMVQWENRLEVIKADHDRLMKSRDALQAEIDQKTADYNIYMAQKDADSKKMRAETMAQSDQLAKDKAEFQDILKKFQDQKAIVDSQAKSIEIDKSKLEEQMNNVRLFISAVQRALAVLGL